MVHFKDSTWHPFIFYIFKMEFSQHAYEVDSTTPNITDGEIEAPTSN